MIGVISDLTSPVVTDLLCYRLAAFTSALQNEICDRAYDYIYYRVGRVYVGNDRADTLLACVYRLHDEYLVRCANRSLAPVPCVPETLAYGLNRRRLLLATVSDDVCVVV